MTGPDFERAVRNLARASWGLPPGEGAAEFIGDDETDYVCRNEDVIHLAECTVEGRTPTIPASAPFGPTPNPQTGC